MLRLTDIHKRFLSRPVLRGIDLEVAAGDRILLTGANGSGKTTLLRILCGALKPDRGRVESEGRDAWLDPRAHRARIGALLDDAGLFPDATLLENLSLFASLVGADARAVGDGMARFGLAPRADATVRTLSRGERQKAGLVRCLLANPPLLVLDEPMNGLDAQARAAARALFAAYRGAVVLASHESEDASAWITRRWHLADGRIGGTDA